MSDSKRTNLGRGLAALLGDDEDENLEAPEPTPSGSRTVPISRLRPNRYQPRRTFDEEAIESLAASLRVSGLLQPILVRNDAEEPGGFEIIAGERRWRAAQRAQLHEVLVVVRDLSDRESLEIAIVENVQRRDLTPLEEGEGYRRLMDEFSHTQEDLARAVGKSRSHIANTLRLLQLPDSVKDLVQSGEISAGHARALMKSEDVEGLARQVAGEGLSVRETERLAQEVKAAARGEDAGGASGGRRRNSVKDPDTRLLEDDLSAHLGLRVDIDAKGESGQVRLQFRNLDQLDDILHRLTHGPAKAPAEG